MVIMDVLLRAERRKLRRSKIIWIAIFATVVVSVIVFAQGNFTYNGVKYVDRAGWYMEAVQSLATFYVLPAVIALFGSYLICREEQEDTLKSLKIVPINEMHLTIAKMLITLLFSMLAYIALFVIAFSAEVVLHFHALTPDLFFRFGKMYM